MLKRFTERFIYHKDKNDPDAHMQGRYFVWSNMAMFLVCLSVIPYYFAAPEVFSENPTALYANIFFLFLIGCIVLIYSKWGGRILWVNLTILLGVGAIDDIYHKTGGIWSSDNIWAITMAAWAFLVAGRTTGLIWMFVALVQIVFLFVAAKLEWHDFKTDLLHFPADMPFFNYLLTIFFLLAVVWLYDYAKKIFVNQLRQSSSEIEQQKKILELQKEDIVASINYAKKIQQAVLPHDEIVARGIPLSFFLYKPRDIVSGDFYWFHELDRDSYVLAIADCTGHGVPGAFMTVIGSNLLAQIVKENNITMPSQILSQLDQRVNETLKQDHARYSEVQDGMDLSLIRVNKAKRELIYTSAKRTALFIRNGGIQELKGSKLSIGGMRSGTKTFDEITIQYQDDDLLYLFTDGYIDQFGGPDNKKFMIKRFRELILSANKLPIPDQKKMLDDTITNWIGTNEQTDDILVCGIRF
jgi:serine phosphatase RsbU (regulator of sigma subunit)